MPTTTLAVEPLSEGVQIGMRVPGILLALVGVVLALAAGRRLGVLAAAFGAIGSAILLSGQVVDVVWIILVNAMAKDTATKPDDYVTVGNLFTVIYAALLTIGLAFLIFAYFVRRPADRRALPGYVSGDFATPGFPAAGYQQPGPGFGPSAPGFEPPPGFGAPPPGFGAPPSGYGPPSSFPGGPSGYPGGPAPT
jgi:hypothetical protein